MVFCKSGKTDFKLRLSPAGKRNPHTASRCRFFDNNIFINGNWDKSIDLFKLTESNNHEKIS